MEIAVHIYRLKALKVPGQKETVNTTQRIFLPQEKPFLHKASPQVLEADPPKVSSEHNQVDTQSFKEYLSKAYSVPGVHQVPGQPQKERQQGPTLRHLTF